MHFLLLNMFRDKYVNESELYGFLAGRVVDGREMAVQFAKYGPNAERM